MNKRGILVVVSGFSGAGKGTLMKRLVQKYDNYALSISATTRTPRAGEVHGCDYFFHTKQEFEQLIEDNELIEFAQYVNNYYGTPRHYVEKQLEAGRNVILEIEIQGALKVKDMRPDTLLLFVTPPNIQELERRLIERGTEDGEVIQSRLQRALEEAKGIFGYDYLLVNDCLEECVDMTHMVIQSACCATSHNTDFINKIQSDLIEHVMQ